MNPKCLYCNEEGKKFRCNRWMCIIHNRIETMIGLSRARGKKTPKWSELQSMVDAVISAGMRCDVCQTTMCWTMAEDRMRVASLQHDRSGKIRIICLRCNMRHGQMPGDDFYSLPVGMKWCSWCMTVKPMSDFYIGRTGAVRTGCKECKRALNKDQWKIHGKRWMNNARRNRLAKI